MNKKGFIRKNASLIVCWISIVIVTICDMLEQHSWMSLVLIAVCVYVAYKNIKEEYNQNKDEDALKNELKGKYGVLVMWVFVFVIYAIGFINGNTITISAVAWLVVSLINIVVLYIDIKRVA